jgi:argininosuccinate lyase
MPQKRNPDAAELVRGKTARVCGSLQALLMLVKGLPLAYNRDLQEDRAALFDAVETTIASTAITEGIWRTVEVRTERFENELRGDLSLTTEIADYLTAEGVPFRDAHEVASRIARWCDERGTNLVSLTPDVAGSFHPKLADADPDLWLDPRAAAQRRTSRGGTAPLEFARQLDLLGVKS